MAGAAQNIPDPDAMLCEYCGYILTGLPEGSRCPECGQATADSPVCQLLTRPEIQSRRPSDQVTLLVRMVGFCTSPLYIRHDPGPHHPERPDRLQAIMAAVRDAGLVLSPNPLPCEDMDFGVHHGNGTQAIFQADPSVLFVSLHQNPHCHYSGSGFKWEIGVGPSLATIPSP